MDKSRLHKIFKSIEMNPRDRKDLVNELSKGGSGGGVNIVDSVDKLYSLNLPKGTIASVAPGITFIKPSEATAADPYVVQDFLSQNDNSGLMNYLNSIFSLCPPMTGIKINNTQDGPASLTITLMFGAGESPQGGLIISTDDSGKLTLGVEFTFVDTEGKNQYEGYLLCQSGVIDENALINFNSILEKFNFKYLYFIYFGNLDPTIEQVVTSIDFFISFKREKRAQSYIKDSNNIIKIADEEDIKNVENRISNLKVKEKIIELSNVDNFTIKPDNYYLIYRDSANEAVITLEEDMDSYKEYMLEIQQGSNDSTLKIINPDGMEVVTWVNGAPTLPAGATILISIIHYIGVYVII